ncbi:hypothetical protein JHK86_024136 [Glycine max]|nr:hypothetical protein JHK86_024136 [Glycine max]
MGVGASAQTTPSAKVIGIFIYPIKSCRGISRSNAPIAPNDFEVRKKDPDFVKGHHQTFFNDGYPFLLTSQIITPAENEIQFYSFGESSLSICISDFQESLVELNNHTKEPIPMNRFRPRYLQSIKRSTAVGGAEPNATLLKTRSGQVLRPNDQMNRTKAGSTLVRIWSRTGWRFLQKGVVKS